MAAIIVSEQARRKTGVDVNAKLNMCGNAQNHSGHSFILYKLKSEHEELWKELAWKMHYIFRKNPYPRLVSTGSDGKFLQEKGRRMFLSRKDNK